MTTIFISDLHLSPQTPEILDGFLHFLEQHARQAEALYILGDLFEVWIGDDNDDALTASVSQALKALSQYVPVFIMPGNRDFLLGKRFAQQCGAQLLADPAVIDLYGTPTLLLHGDSLCTADHAYQRWRKFARNSFLQKLFLALPLLWRLKIAENLRQRSRQHVRALSLPEMDIVQTTALAMLRKYRTNQMIHGHTHIPTIHYFCGGQQSAWRFVLGDWHSDKGSALIFSPACMPRLLELG